MLKKTMSSKKGNPTQFIICNNSIVISPRIKATCRRTHARCTLIGPLKLKFTIKRFKMRQCLNKVLQRSVSFHFSGICLLQWQRSTIRLIQIAIFWRFSLGHCHSSIYSLIVPLSTANISCIFIEYTIVGIQISCISPALRHSYNNSQGCFFTLSTVAWLGNMLTLLRILSR